MLVAASLLFMLFVFALQRKLTWLHGYLWVLILCVAQSGSGLYGLYQLAAGPAWLRLVFVCFIPLIISLWGALWFLLANFIEKKFAMESSAQRLVLWLLAFWCLYSCLIFYPLILLGCTGCYFPLNPLLVFVEQPLLALLLSTIGTGFLLFLFLGIIALCAYAWFMQSAGLAVSIAAPLFALLFLNKNIPGKINQEPTWLRDIGVLQRRFCVSNSMVEEIKRLQASVRRLKKYHCILTPEACVYDHHFFSVPAFYQLWAQQEQTPVMVIAGFRWAQNCYHNSLFYITNGTVQAVFDKRHTLPILEHMPAWLDGEWLHSLYFSATPVRSAGTGLRPVWRLCDGIAVVPYICSELLARQYPDDGFPNVMILAVCNDAWAPAAARAAMLLVARYQAIAWQREILYVSYAYAVFIDKRGVNRKISETSINIYE
jgi:hypothetical protein